MLAGEPYDPADPQLVAERRRARELCRDYNASGSGETERRAALLRELIPDSGANPTIEPPFFCDYGFNIHLGERAFLNFNCVVLDVAPVTIGDLVLAGPGVHIYTATHELDHRTRRTGLEFGRAVNIGSDVWIGGGALILLGVNIGDRTVVGAGSVVTRDLPADVFAAGNPCRIIRRLGQGQEAGQ